MSELYERIEGLCKEQGISITEMCRRANVQRGNLSDLKYERQKGLSTENMIKLANYFGVSVEYLQSGIKKEPVTEDDGLVLDAQEKAFIDWLRALPPEKRQAVLHFQDMF